ncbi:MAG: hypothetical protein JWO99_486 [Candidatus Saccharibacteria bacterium]|nr:hypothetical protein [Candidatus Saccharibacteria bacterium]
MHKLLHSHHPFRIFWFSAIATIATLVGLAFGLGFDALFIAVILIIVEITFSFENAVINAKVLAKLSRFWQNIFLSIGIIIAIFGMRIVFPIVIVMITTGLNWGSVINLAFKSPQEYSLALDAAHPQIAAFGGAFLLMLALHFFFDDEREVLWIKRFERWFQRNSTNWAPAVIALLIVSILALLPVNEHHLNTFIAGVIGIATYSVLQIIIKLFERMKSRGDKKHHTSKLVVQTGMVAFTSFIYLEILDASFSFDSVVGAFAITTDVLLIALGLGVGAIWVRSLTIFMVRRGTLNSYKYLEHGAHYTVLVLSAVLLFGIFIHVPEVIAGGVGIILIGSAILSSRTRPQ